jgi:hypothetical protein
MDETTLVTWRVGHCGHRKRRYLHLQLEMRDATNNWLGGAAIIPVRLVGRGLQCD